MENGRLTDIPKGVDSVDYRPGLHGELLLYKGFGQGG